MYFLTYPARWFSMVLLAAFVLSPIVVNAQVTQNTEISADRFVVRDSENKSEFIGNVVITQPGLKVWADRVVVNFGEGGTSDVKTFVATGNVKIQSDVQTATGQRAEYRPATRILHLTGNVVVVNEGGTVLAQELFVNLATNVTEFSSGGTGQRVTGLFTPNN
ncbi:MAG: hypothetical protein L3J13_00595 [Devosiaceae bacterium]|nr:hypothetical protein [Devosiaceae bacterium]